MGYDYPHKQGKCVSGTLGAVYVAGVLLFAGQVAGMMLHCAMIVATGFATAA